MNINSDNEGLELYQSLRNRQRFQESEIGDDVTVVDAGQSYTGKVQAKTADGKLKISFAGKRPNRDTYGMAEIKPVKPGQATTAPTTSVVPTRPATQVLPAMTR